MRDNVYKESAPYGGLRQLLEIFLQTVPSGHTRHLPTHMPVVFSDVEFFLIHFYMYQSGTIEYIQT